MCTKCRKMRSGNFIDRANSKLPVDDFELIGISLTIFIHRNTVVNKKRLAITGKSFEGAVNGKTDRVLVDFLLVSCGKCYSLARAGSIFLGSLEVLRSKYVSRPRIGEVFGLFFVCSLVQSGLDGAKLLTRLLASPK